MAAAPSQGSVWAPSNEGLQQLLALFHSAPQASNAQHRAIQQQLVEFNAIPDYNNYLAYILNHLRHEQGAVRQLAGLTLKNNCSQHWLHVQPAVQEYVRDALLCCLSDPAKYIRQVVSSCITAIVQKGGLETWPTLVPALYRMLDSNDPNVLDGAFASLSKICEDSPEKLARDVRNRPLDRSF